MLKYLKLYLNPLGKSQHPQIQEYIWGKVTTQTRGGGRAKHVVLSSCVAFLKRKKTLPHLCCPAPSLSLSLSLVADVLWGRSSPFSCRPSRTEFYTPKLKGGGGGGGGENLVVAPMQRVAFCHEEHTHTRRIGLMSCQYMAACESLSLSVCVCVSALYVTGCRWCGMMGTH